MSESQLRFRIKFLIIFFICSILLSGITAFPLDTELAWLNEHKNIFPDSMADWLGSVYYAEHDTNEKYPFLAYGTDWLAFAHVVIALIFIGPLKDPVRNKWVIDWAIIACFCVFPLALIAGPIRNVPMFHRLIDCSFGAIGLIPLFVVRNYIKKLQKFQI